MGVSAQQALIRIALRIPSNVDVRAYAAERSGLRWMENSPLLAGIRSD
jgi:hypothetical protein